MHFLWVYHQVPGKPRDSHLLPVLPRFALGHRRRLQFITDVDLMKRREETWKKKWKKKNKEAKKEEEEKKRRRGRNKKEKQEQE